MTMEPGRAAAALSNRKHRAVQRAGTRVFLERGYSAATMDLIATEAGVSKQTVYNHFRSKEVLFKAIVDDLTTQLTSRLADPPDTDAGPEEVLTALGRELLAMMLRPTSLSLYRLIVAESARFPEFGTAIYSVGAGRMIEMLADYLVRETGKGALSVSEPELAAEQFVGMLTGRLQLRALLGVETLPDERELERRADYAVRCFLAQHAP